MSDSGGNNSNKSSTGGHNSLSSSPLFDTAAPIPSDDISTCPYCNRGFRKPRVLDCLHSMCEDCVIAQLDGRNDAKRNQSALTDFELEQAVQTRPTPPGVIKCPICSQESQVGNDIRFVNCMLLDFIRIRETSQNGDLDSSTRICRACKGEQQAIANCRQCPGDLCKNCVQAHRDMRMFDGHKVVMFSDMDKEKEENVLKADGQAELIHCTLHNDSYAFLCQTCDELICQQCLPEHNNVHHIIRPLDESLKHFYQKNIQNMMEQLEQKGKASFEARSAIPERQLELENSERKCREKIDEAFEILLELIKLVKEKVVADLKKNKDDKDAFYDNLYQHIDTQYAYMQDAINFTNRLLEKGTAVEVVASQKKVYQHLRQLLHGMPDVNTEVELEFELPNKAELQKKLEGIMGGVKCRVAPFPSKDFSQNAISIPPPKEIRNGSGPGTIGMERRQQQSRTSITGSGGFLSSSFLSGDSGNFSESTLLSPVGLGTPITANTNTSPTTDSFGIGRLAISAEGYGGGVGNSGTISSGSRTPQNLLHGLDMGQSFGPITDPFSQTKGIWGTPFGQAHQMALYNGGADNSLLQRAKQQQMEPRYMQGLTDFSVLGVTGLDQGGYQHSRSSLCTTPSFDNSFGVPIEKNVNTIDMTMAYSFGTTGVETLSTPQGFTLGLDDEIAIADTNNHRCLVFNIRGQFLRQVGSSGTEEGCVYFPKKVVAYIRGRDCRYITLDRGAHQSFVRLQIFRNSGEFISRLASNYNFEQISVMTINKENDQLVLIDAKSNVVVLQFETFNQMRTVNSFSINGHVHEGSDIAVYKGNYFITDYKTHYVNVFNQEGKLCQKFGGTYQTPYPIGIDISKSGDILVGDSHGNHFHVAVYNCGRPQQVQQDYKCITQKVSRCTGLKISTDGYVVTMSRQNSCVLVFNTLYLPQP